MVTFKFLATWLALTPKRAKNKNCQKFILLSIEKQTIPCKSTAEQVSFEWPYHRILSTDSKVRTTLYVAIIYSLSGKVNTNCVH